MNHGLNILAEQDWSKIVIGVIVVGFWILNGLATAFKKKPGPIQRPNVPQQPSALEIFQREVAERLRRGQMPGPPQLPPVGNPQISAMQRRQTVQRQQTAARKQEGNQRAVNPPAMVHPERAAMHRRQAVQKKQTAARQAQAPSKMSAKRRSAPPPIPTATESAPEPIPAAVAAELNPRAHRQALPPVNAAVIAAWMKPDTLRKQFIITEIFQPPLSMRE